MDMRFLPFAIATAFASFVALPVEAQMPQSTRRCGAGPSAARRRRFHPRREFVQNITQIAMGHAADDQGANPGIHSLANRIVASHTKADQAPQAARIAEKNVGLPGGTDIDPDHAESSLPHSMHARHKGGKISMRSTSGTLIDDRTIA